MQTCRLIIALGGLAAAGWAQSSAGVAGPVTGFIFDAQSGAVRPMLGIPGGAYLGNGITAGLNAASVAPDGSAALAVQAGGKLVLYSGLRNGTPVATAVAGGIAGADFFAWAADGSSAAVYSSRSGQAQIVSGMAGSPVGAAAFDLAGLPGPVTVLAFDGQRLIVGVAGGVYTATAAGVQRVASGVVPSAIALAGGCLFVADGQAQQIWQVQNYATVPAAVVFASDSGISSPVGLQVSADGQRLYSANAGGRTVEVYDIASRSAVQSIALDFVPTRLDRFGDASVFLLNSGGGSGPVYVVRDGGLGKAAVYFVPSPAKRGVARAPVRPS
jgi:hypothetical protein